MTSLLQDILYEVQGQAPSPSKDFYHFLITKNQVILRSWKISVRTEHKKVLPREIKATHSEFLEDSGMQKQLQLIFGKETMQYVLCMCRGNCDFFVRLPDVLKIHILSFLDINDIKHISETCKTFHKLCNSEEFWEKIKEKQINAHRRKAFPGKNNQNEQAGRLGWMQRRKASFF
ncbi:hypothetical protein GDO86_003892 [Hymenochirus boettgeri]|uniref:F-box domain-containing protein n=1 Tax=Hymenochirus boettgeri TaxID=247094 RepID=A0A8T2K311_9PIPI|nr:hypothetical protein GDO86_003892 [Hymenochirus boettgeri]